MESGSAAEVEDTITKTPGDGVLAEGENGLLHKPLHGSLIVCSVETQLSSGVPLEHPRENGLARRVFGRYAPMLREVSDKTPPPHSLPCLALDLIAMPDASVVVVMMHT